MRSHEILSPLRDMRLLELADLLGANAVSRGFTAELHTALWIEACHGHGICIAYSAPDPRLLVQVAHAAKAFPGEPWSFNTEEEARGFVENSRGVLQASSVAIGSRARFSLKFHELLLEHITEELAWLAPHHAALLRGFYSCHVPIRVTLSEDEKGPRSHWANNPDVLPPKWDRTQRGHRFM